MTAVDRPRPQGTPLARRLCALAAAALLAVAATACAWVDRPVAALGIEPPTRPPAQGEPAPRVGQGHRQGVVAAANPYGAEAGARILEQGGNAVDAAVAVAYALNVVEPQSAGIGGGGFMLIHLAHSGQTLAIDSRETAPAGATRDMFVGVPHASLQGVAVGVPGMVRGTAMALAQYGNLSLAQVLQPAIALADEGFAATPRYAAVSCNPRSQNSPEARAFFCPEGGGNQGPAVGSLVQNKPLADTLRRLAAHGPDCFYKLMPEKGCDIARGIVEGQKYKRPEPGSKGGSMTLADLEAYRPALRQPTVGRYRGYLVQSMSPPSSGGLTMIQMLAMLERFPIGDTSQGFGFGSPKTAGAMADAMRLAFADRAQWMGDADFVPVPAKGLLDPAYVGARGAAILPGLRLTPDPTAGDPRPYDTAGIAGRARLDVADPVTSPENGTTHIVVIDRWGNLVSYTNTIEAPHGIGVFAGYRRGDGSFRNLGFLLNNELTDFNAAPSTNPYTGGPGFNDVQPGHRPRSSMSPTIVFSPDGQPLAAYGSQGGATIVNTVLNVTLNLIDHRMALQQAIDAPRLSVTDAGSTIMLEPGYPSATVDALRERGYTVNLTAAGAGIGSLQAVAIDPRTGRQVGGADARREGTVIGLPRAGGN